MAKNYTAEQVADVIMNDDIEEMDSTDSLDEESSSSSSNDELSSQSEVDSSSIILTLSFMVGKSLSKNLLFETFPQSVPKQEKGSQTMVELSEQEEAFQNKVEYQNKSRHFKPWEKTREHKRRSPEL